MTVCCHHQKYIDKADGLSDGRSVHTHLQYMSETITDSVVEDRRYYEYYHRSILMAHADQKLLVSICQGPKEYAR